MGPLIIAIFVWVGYHLRPHVFSEKNHLTTGAEGFFYVADGDKGCTRITHKNWLVFWEPLKDALVVFVKESLTWEKNSFETNGT